MNPDISILQSLQICMWFPFGPAVLKRSSYSSVTMAVHSSSLVLWSHFLIIAVLISTSSVFRRYLSQTLSGVVVHYPGTWQLSAEYQRYLRGFLWPAGLSYRMIWRWKVTGLLFCKSFLLGEIKNCSVRVIFAFFSHLVWFLEHRLLEYIQKEKVKTGRRLTSPSRCRCSTAQTALV